MAMHEEFGLSVFCWLRVEVEPSPLQKFLKPFFILAPKWFLRSKKDKSFIVLRGSLYKKLENKRIKVVVSIQV